MTKVQWEKKLQDINLPVTLENNVLMCKTGEKDVAIKFHKAIKDYPYSWGIKKLGNGEDFADEEEVV